MASWSVSSTVTSHLIHMPMDIQLELQDLQQDYVQILFQLLCKDMLEMVRPPGHHAGLKQPMGFCLHNNAAVAALAAQAAGADRVDWVMDDFIQALERQMRSYLPHGWIVDLSNVFVLQFCGEIQESEILTKGSFASTVT
ncbi:Histone deacetylase 15 [Nymphaea thermarum]|nr:Histone deacetylase 15 [Nymphaea thermarum]